MFGRKGLNRLGWGLVVCILSAAATAGTGSLLPPTSEWWSYTSYIDSDRSGGISLNEIRPFVPGATPFLFSELDRDKDGQVKPPDIDGLTLNDEVAFALNLYRAIDKDYDGSISPVELNAFTPLIVCFVDVFGQYDKNKDGVLSPDDLVAYLAPASTPPIPSIDGLFKQLLTIDANYDGCFSYKEAQALIPSISVELFNLLDVNGDGTICAEDLTALTGDDVPALVDEVLALADKNRDGSLSLAEAQAFIPALTADMFNYLDRNGDGVLSMEDITGGTLPPPPEDPCDELLQVFKAADIYGSGCLNYNEAKTIFPAMTPAQWTIITNPTGMETFAPIELCYKGFESMPEPIVIPSTPLPVIQAVVDPIIKMLDKDGDGSISLEELQAFMPSMTANMFKCLDRNGDGVLNVDDLVYTPPPPPPVVTSWQDLLKLLDPNGDGCLVFADVQKYIPAFPPDLFNLLETIAQGPTMRPTLNNVLCIQALYQFIRPSDYPAIADIILKVADTNGDGSLSFAEAKAFLPLLTQSMFAEIDRNGDGALSISDIPGYQPPPPPVKDPVQELMAIYRAADKDGDGCLTYAELATIFPVLGQLPQPMFICIGCPVWKLCPSDFAPPDWDKINGLVKTVLTLADTDQDGSLSFAEAQAFMPAMTPEIFNFLDQNGDGVLSVDDIPGYQPPPPPPVTTWQDLLKLLDPNGDGCLAFADVQKYIPAFPPDLFNLLETIAQGPTMRPTLKNVLCIQALYQFIQPSDYPAIADIILKVADTDGDGSLSFAEAKAFIPLLTQSMFAEIDRNGDGVLSVDDIPGYQPPPPPPVTTWQDLLKLLDPNGDGCMAWADVQKYIPAFPPDLFNLLETIAQGPTMRPTLKNVLCIQALYQFIQPSDYPAIADIILKVADADGDGSLSFAEAKAFIPLLTQSMFAEIDRNGDGVLSISDIPGYQPPPPPPPVKNPLQELLAIFQAADTDGDGCLTYAELATIFPSLERVARPMVICAGCPEQKLCLSDIATLSASQINNLAQEVLMLADTDRDGSLSFAEAQAFMPAMTPEIFKFLDQNGDGVLDISDLTGGTTPPVDWSKPPLDNAQALLTWLFKNADADADGAISFAEAQTVVPELTKATFAKLDTNGDGVLTLDDLSVLLPDDAATLIARLLKSADKNGDGKLSLDEVRTIVPGFSADFFAKLDRNGDGFLGLDDLPNAPPQGPRESLLAILRDSDANNDGVVTLDEFLAAHPELTADDFMKLDNNGDGVLTKEDAVDGALDPAQALLQILRTADANHDGQVTLAELQAIRPDITAEQFAKLDANGDGVLTKEDLPKPQDPVSHLRALLPQADVNGDKKVTFDELKAVAPDLTRELFAKLDTNGDGVITPDDFVQPPQDPRDALLALIRAADSDQDGSVTFAEVSAVRPDITQDKFNALDKNGDGVLSAADVQPDPVPTDTDLRKQLLQQLVKADTNHDGQLDYAEIAAAFPDASSGLLASIDTNHDWVVTRDELMASLGHDDNGQALVDPEDVDCDGAVTAVDLQLAVNTVLGKPTNVMVGGVGGSGPIDAVGIQRIVLKILKSF